MKKLPVQFRCYAEYDHAVSAWVAVCVDLSLGAQADTLQEAKAKIHAQINDYFQDALDTRSWSEALEMLSRKAPISLVYRYHTIKARQGIANFVGKHVDAVRFKDSVEGLTLHAA